MQTTQNLPIRQPRLLEHLHKLRLIVKWHLWDAPLKVVCNGLDQGLLLCVHSASSCTWLAKVNLDACDGESKSPRYQVE
jgi:hypothetical protein